MKKLPFLIVLSVLCVLLAACEAERPESTQETPCAPAQTISETLDSAYPSLNFAQETGYQYGNMQKNVPSGNFAQYGDSVLFTHTAPSGFGKYLYSYDMATGEVSLFCKDATCNHTSKECAAYGADDNLEQYQGNIYASRLNGAVLELKKGKFEPITDSGVSHFWHSGGKLYVVTKDSSLVAYEQGKSKPHMLIEEYTGFWETVFGGFLYYSSSYNVNRINLNSPTPEKEVLIENAEFITDGQYIYYAPEGTFYLYRCDMGGGDPELLLKEPVLPASWNFDEEFFYFRLYKDHSLDGEDSNVLYRFPKDDPSHVDRIAELDIPIAFVYTVPGFDKIFVIGQTDGNEPAPVYEMNRDGSGAKLIELPEF